MIDWNSSMNQMSFYFYLNPLRLRKDSFHLLEIFHIHSFELNLSQKIGYATQVLIIDCN